MKQYMQHLIAVIIEIAIKRVSKEIQDLVHILTLTILLIQVLEPIRLTKKKEFNKKIKGSNSVHSDRINLGSKILGLIQKKAQLQVITPKN